MEDQGWSHPRPSTRYYSPVSGMLSVTSASTSYLPSSNFQFRVSSTCSFSPSRFLVLGGRGSPQDGPQNESLHNFPFRNLIVASRSI